MMKYSVWLHNKAVEVELSAKAENALLGRDTPINVAVHLIFGCMIAKRVWFNEQGDAKSVRVNGRLNLSFEAVRYSVCSFAAIDGGATPEPFPLQKSISKFVPDYLFVDHRKGKFKGDFTYRGNPVLAEQEGPSARTRDLSVAAAGSVE